MAFELLPNRGSLFKNQYKTQPNHPNFKGTMKVGENLVEIAGWEKETRNGDMFISLKIQEPNPKYKKQNTQQSAPPPQQSNDSGSGDLPWEN